MDRTPARTDASTLRQRIEALEYRLAKQAQLLEAQGRLIERLRDQLRTFILLQRRLPALHSPAFHLVHTLRGLRRRFLSGPGQLRHHSPRPLEAPSALGLHASVFHPMHHLRRLRLRFLPGPGRLHHHQPRPLTLPSAPIETSRAPHGLPRISVVTPNLDGVEFLEKTLLSVLDQHYPALEYIVQDGGSRDGSREIIERHAQDLHHAGFERDRGRTHAVNLGFEKSTGEIMAWLSSDDLLLPGCLDYVARYFTEHQNVDALYGHRILIDRDGMEIGRWVLPPHDNATLSWADYVPQESLFWRRSLWERVGGHLDESFQFALDWDLLLRFRDAEANIIRVPRYLGAFRVHEAQQSTREIDTVGAQEMARLRTRCHGRVVEPLEIDRACAAYLRRASAHRLMHLVGIRGF